MRIIASRYASALFELAQEEKNEALLKEQVKLCLQSFEAHPELIEILRHTQFSKQEKKQILEDIYGGIAHPYVLHVMKFMIDKHRARLIPLMFKAYLNLHNTYFNILEAIAYTVHPLSPEEIHDLERELGHKEQQTVMITNRIDKSLMSGIKLSYQDKIVDASMRGRIEKLRESLLKERA